MKIKVLIDNISKDELLKEWGLCIYIEDNDRKFLLDSGASNKFTQNAENLKIDLSKVDYAVLSHSHFDHANGIEAFFNLNKKAHFILRDKAIQKCYHHHFWFVNEYIGIKRKWLKKYSDRFDYVSGNYKIDEGVFLIPHYTPNLEEIAKRSKLYVKKGFRIVPDSFEHEQSLVFETEKGLVIFNSCCHGGVANIINEVSEIFPQKPVYAILGGFHLFRLSEDEVRAFAKQVSNAKIAHLVTGHCTGQRAFEILREELGEKVQQMYSGMEIEI